MTLENILDSWKEVTRLFRPTTKMGRKLRAIKRRKIKQLAFVLSVFGTRTPEPKWPDGEKIARKFFRLTSRCVEDVERLQKVRSIATDFHYNRTLAEYSVFLNEVGEKAAFFVGQFAHPPRPGGVISREYSVHTHERKQELKEDLEVRETLSEPHEIFEMQEWVYLAFFFERAGFTPAQAARIACALLKRTGTSSTQLSEKTATRKMRKWLKSPFAKGHFLIWDKPVRKTP